MVAYNSNSVVDKIGEMGFEGNIIPHNWYKTVTKTTPIDGSKPDTIGIIILADIVYWYRPTIIRDEATGSVISIKKKFKADKLQRSYEQISEQFGFSKRQARDAIYRLRDLGLITLEFRNLKVNGRDINNVLYIEPIAENIKKATFEHAYTENEDTLLQKNVTGYTKNDGTNTKITTKITTKIKTVDEKPSSTDLKETLRKDQEILNEILEDDFAENEVALSHLYKPSKHITKPPSLSDLQANGFAVEKKNPVPKNWEGEREKHGKQVNKGGVNVKSSPRNSTVIIAHFRDLFKESFSGAIPPIDISKDRTLLKKLIEGYDFDTVMNMLNYMFANWARFKREVKLKTDIPTIGILWGFRDHLYGKIMYATVSSDEDSAW